MYRRIAKQQIVDYLFCATHRNVPCVHLPHFPDMVSKMSTIRKKGKQLLKNQQFKKKNSEKSPQLLERIHDS